MQKRFSVDNFCLTVPEKIIGELVFQKKSGIEKFYAKEGYLPIFRRKFIASQYQKLS